MSTFNVDQYLNQKYGAPAPDKITAIEKAKEDKIASLQAFRNALAENGQQALRDQAIANGRTLGEFGTDVGLSALQGIDGLAKIPAMVYDKATTGNFYGPETQAISEVSDQREKLKSALSQAKGQEKAIAVKQAGDAAKEYFGDGIGGTAAQVAAEFGTAFWEAAKDPASIPEFLAQQAAQLGVMGKVGRASEALAVSAAKAAPALASTAAGKAALGNIGTSGAVATGAVLQGVDTGSDTMQRMMKLPDAVWEQNPEYVDLASKTSPEQAKQEIASRLASEATIKAGVASVLSSALPGGNAVEKALVGKSMGGFKAVPKAFMGEAGQEGIEEGTGKFFGNDAVKTIDATQALSEGVGAAAGQGSFMGGVLGGGINAGQAALDKLGASAIKKGEKAQEAASQVEALKAAIATGDTSAYLDPKNPSYSPDKAVQVLYGNSQLPTTTPEAKQANLEQASKIIADLEEAKAKEVSALEDLSPASTAKMKADAAAARAAGDLELAQQIEEEVAFNEKDTTTPVRQAKIKKIESQLAAAQEVLSVFGQEVQNSTVDVKTEVEKVNGPDAKVAQESADKIINLSMSIPERLDPAVATQLADNTNNSLTDTQRTYLRNFSQARVAENELKDMGKVSQEILFGSKPTDSGTKYIGLTNYRARMSAALVSNNQKSAERVLGLIGKFSAGHKAKADAATEAYEMFRKDGKDRHIANVAGKWVIQDGLWPSNKERIENGGLNINGNAKDLVANTAAESVAISKAEAELKAAYDVKFAKANNVGNGNVQNVQKTSEGVQVSSEKLQSQTTEKAGTNQGTEAAVAGTGTTKSADVATATEAPASTVKTVEPETTQGQLQSTEKTTTTAEPVANEGQAETGTLQAIQNKSPEGTPHNEKKFGDFFTQKADQTTSASSRPLVMVKDFLTKLNAGAVNISDFLKDKTTEPSAIALAAFTKFAAQWAPRIQKNLKPSHNEKFNYEDPIRYLIQTLTVDGKKSADVEENVKTAIAAAVFAYVSDQAGRSEINDDVAMNGILGKSKDAPVTTDVRAILEKIGVYQPQVVDSLGSHVLDALGFKLLKDAPKDMLAKLRVSLGAHTLKLMVDTKILERESLTNGQMAELRETAIDQTELSDSEMTALERFNNREGHVFYKLSRDQVGKPTGTAQEISEALQGSGNLIQNLFGIESGATFPSMVPPKGVQQKSDTGMGVPGFMKKVFKLNQSRPWKLNKDPMKVLSFFSEEDGMKMAGVDMDTSHVHKRNQNSHRAKNSGLIREFQSFMEYVGQLAASKKGTEQEFYLTQEMWKQQRSGYKTNTVNPNTSKIVRWLIASDAWTTEIQISNKAQLQSFMLRVSEGFGIKPEKAASQKGVDSLLAVMAEPTMQAAVKALQSVLFTPDAQLTEQQRTDVMKAVADGKQKLHTLAALIAYARYQQALDTDSESFTTNMMGEVDGVSNGSILNSIMYGASQTVKELNNLLEKGGIYTLASKFSKYNEWRGTPGHQDIYETNAQDLHTFVANMPEETKTITGAIWATAGSPINAASEATKEGRDLLKGPINPLNYGGGFKSIIKKMSADYVDTIYSKFEGFSKKGADQAVIDTFVSHLNTLLRSGRAQQLPLNKPISFYLGYTMSKSQEAALMRAYSSTVGTAAQKIVGANFKPFLDRSRVVNQTVNLAFSLYTSVHTAARTSLLKELGVPFKNGEPIHDLSQEQEDSLAERLKGILPIMNTAMSQVENNPENGILLAKTKRIQSPEDSYSVAVGFGSPLVTGARQMTVAGRTITQDSPGVVAISGTTHALDSYSSHEAQEKNHVVNNHDAVGDGIKTLAESAESLNKSTWTNTLNYSPLTEAHNALMRVVQGLVDMDSRGELTPEMKAAIRESLDALAKTQKKAKAETIIEIFAARVFSEAYEANLIKYSAMSQWAVVDQYAMDGGSYTVTQADRDEASKRLADLQINAKRTPEEVKALEDLYQMLFGKNAVQAPVDVIKPKAESPFGALGDSDIPSEPDLVDFFENNQEASAADVIALLGAPGRMNAINRKILALVSRVVGSDLKIRYVTSETPQDSVLDKATTNARGWYVVKNGAEEIYVLSPEFVHSGLTAETLLHELVHAAIAKVIDNPTGDAKALVAELEALRVKAQEYATKNGLTQYGPALSSVQELVAWGMSNLGFQKDVLNKITMESKTGSNRLVTAMQKFISTLTALLFKKPDQNIDNGLSVLISNVSGLFYEASQQKVKKESDLNLSQESTSKVDSYTTLDIHRALDNGTLEPAFQEHLANLLGGIVETLHGPFGALAAAMRKTEAKNPLAVWLKAMETGQAPFASQIVASGFAGTSQEDFAMQQVEATVKAALNGTGPTTSMGYIAYKELSALYMEMRAKLKPSDFASQADYDFVFKIEANNGDKSDYLARFAAMGLASHKFNQLLKVATEKNTSKFGSGKTFTERLQNIFEKILAFFSEKATHTFAGQQADSKLEALVEQLVAIEAKKRHAIELGKTQTNYLAPIEKGVKKVTEGIRTKIGDIAGSAFVRKNSNAFVRAAGGVARTIANDQVEFVLDGLQRLRDQQFKGRPGIVASLMTEMKGLPEQFMVLLRETKRREGERKSIITEHAKLALKTFANEGKNLTKEAKGAISLIFMRTGAHNLLDHMTLAELENVLDNPTELNKAIDKLESQLTTRMKSKYLEQINGLGYFKATGKSRTAVLMLNAHLIARMAGTKYQRFVTPAEAKAAEPIIAALVSLYALKYSDSKALSDAKQVFRDENNRTDGNGVEFVLKLHKSLEAEALQRLFKGNPALMIHGYTPEILNPHTSIKVADDLEGPDLIAQGYTKGALVTNDRADPLGTPKHIYVLRDGGLAPWLSGVFSLSGMQAKGSKKHNGYLNVNNQNGLANASLQAEITNEKLDQMSNSVNPKRDLSQQLGNNLVPVYNEAGEIVNWRYVMAESTKDDLLERNNDFDQVVGVLAGSIYDKETTREQNLKAIVALRDIFREEYATRKDSYIEVGAKSTDPEMRAIWNLLPDRTKMDIREIWGRDGMLVRKDSLDVMFGYRKLSIADFLRNDPDSLKGLQKIFREWFNIYAKSQGMNPDEADNYAKRIGVALSKGERAWQEIVREAKDIIVVKTGLVMLGNIWSNISLLAMSGVSMKNLLDHHLVAMKAATDYQRDSKELAELESLLSAGYTQGNEPQLRKEVARLKDAIANNPVKDLIDAGLMPTIVEDVAADDDIYSYKSLFARKTEKYTKKLNPKILKAGRLVYMTHDTGMYQNLSRITQLSDFVARYTLYQHLTSRAENPLSKAEAVKEASDAFVNYDVPMHRGLQYSDDMGFTPFTKYFLRIQRVLLKLARENPARVLGTIALNNYMDLGSIVLESSFTHHIGNNPLRSGAFQYFGALDDLATIKGSMALIK